MSHGPIACSKDEGRGGCSLRDGGRGGISGLELEAIYVGREGGMEGGMEDVAS